MQIFIYIIIFMFGLVLGSFYNVLGYRLPKKESIVFPSSHCPNCNHQLKFWDLIPVLSYIFLQGKCHYCKKKISIIYPIIELATAILFITSYYIFGFSMDFFIALIFSSICIITISSDIRYMIIEDSVLIVGEILILILTLIKSDIKTTFLVLLNGLISFLIIYIVKLLADHYFKTEAMGGGDVKFMFVVGSLITYKMSFIALCMASFIAFPYAIYIYLSKKDNILPLGPFLCIAGLIIYFSGLTFNDLMLIMAK